MLEPQNSQGSSWVEDSIVANPELQELNTVIYKTHSIQDQDHHAALQLLVLAYINVEKG